VVEFGEFTNQVEYADAATALNDEMREQVLADLDPASLAGKKVSFVGAVSCWRQRRSPSPRFPWRYSHDRGPGARGTRRHQGLRRHSGASGRRLHRPPRAGHALFGENGAGKSTLMKVLAGIVSPTTGEIRLDGEVVRFVTPREATDRGIAIIHQELSLCPNMSVTDNLFLARERTDRFGAVERSSQREDAQSVLRRLEEEIDPDIAVQDLRLGQQQVVEIARALLQQARVLIMDEPTSALSTPEIEVLFRVIRELTATGVTIIYISHHLDEALEIADDVVVLRMDRWWPLRRRERRRRVDRRSDGRTQPGVAVSPSDARAR
jgi:ABC-type branched-subunit amino acid transport system ATPase component